jgi:hypothetical protein
MLQAKPAYWIREVIFLQELRRFVRHCDGGLITVTQSFNTTPTLSFEIGEGYISQFN